jgi:surface antigen
MRRCSIFLCLSAAILLPSIAHSQSCPALGPKMVVGAAVGAGAGTALGGLLGGKNRALGAAVGGIGGGAIGGAIGNALDQRDCQMAQAALQQMATARTGQPISWSDPATGNRGAFTPLANPTKSADGRFCRPYSRAAVTKDGQQMDGGSGVTCCSAATGDCQAMS